MLNHRIFSGMILLCFLGMLSCTEVIKESQKVLKETQKPIVEGKFFPLETEGIKMYLPKEFKKLSKSEYLEFVEKSTDTLAVNLEKERLRDLARSQSKVYFFQHTSSNSILTVFPTEYIKFTKNDAQMLLNDIKYHHDEISEQSGILFTKKEARFFETAEAQIFKSIYSISSEDLIGDFYKQIYFVSFNNKSFALTLETPFLVDFDPYLEKIRVL
jgi:hypothetical protein